MDEAGWNAQRRTRLSHPAEAKRFVYWVVVDVGVAVDNAVVEGVMLGFVVLFVVDVGWEVGWEEAEGAGSEGLEAFVGGIGEIRDPGRTAGAQETALQPIACPLKISASQDPSS